MQKTLKKYVNFSNFTRLTTTPFWIYLDLFRPIWTYLDLFRLNYTYLDLDAKNFEKARQIFELDHFDHHYTLDLSRTFGAYLDLFGPRFKKLFGHPVVQVHLSHESRRSTMNEWRMCPVLCGIVQLSG